jgi:2-amino-4-hydroxy-6-hydroxymethyldihydropteridine diphosphokinase
MSRRAALALGSNLGDRLDLLRAAVRDLAGTPGLEIVASSAVYETAPVGGPRQGAYLNAVVVVRTDLASRALLDRALAVESDQGRVRLERWGPRTLDIDVLSVADEVSDDPVLTLPHPRAHERAFVLVPWAEADPTYVVPRHGTTVADLLEALPPQERAGVVRVYAAEALTDPAQAPA